LFYSDLVVLQYLVPEFMQRMQKQFRSNAAELQMRTEDYSLALINAQAQRKAFSDYTTDVMVSGKTQYRTIEIAFQASRTQSWVYWQLIWHDLWHPYLDFEVPLDGTHAQQNAAFTAFIN